MKVLEDLVERFHLYAVCTDCERMERLPLATLIEQHGSNLTIDDVRRRLRCARCRQRTGDIRIVYVGEGGKLAGFHYRGSPRHRPGLQVIPGTQPVSSSVDSSVSPKPSTPT